LFIAVVVATENDGNGIIFGADSSDDDGHDHSEAENDGSDGEDYNKVEVDEDEDEGVERSGRHNQYDPLDVYNGGDMTMTIGLYVSFSKEEAISGRSCRQRRMTAMTTYLHCFAHAPSFVKGPLHRHRRPSSFIKDRLEVWWCPPPQVRSILESMGDEGVALVDGLQNKI
jgi:hypothetical protein